MTPALQLCARSPSPRVAVISPRRRQAALEQRDQPAGAPPRATAATVAGARPRPRPWPPASCFAASMSANSISASKRSSRPSTTRSRSPARAAISIISVASSSCRARVVGRVVGGDVALDRVGQRGRVAQPPGGGERLRAQRVPRARVAAGVAERAAGETGEQPDPQRAVLGAERGERALEKRDESRVVARDAPREPPAVAERRPAECSAQAAGARRARRPRRTARLDAGVSPARAWASPSASSSSQRATGVALERERHLVEADRLLVGELGGGAVAGAAGVGDRLRGGPGAPRRSGAPARRGADRGRRRTAPRAPRRRAVQLAAGAPAVSSS